MSNVRKTSWGKINNSKHNGFLFYNADFSVLRISIRHRKTISVNTSGEINYINPIIYFIGLTAAQD
jgi:hypothetical protein